jgi:hypothetical protein
VDRRTWLTGSLGLLAAPLAGEAQQPGRVYGIGFLGTFPSPTWEAVLARPDEVIQ